MGIINHYTWVLDKGLIPNTMCLGLENAAPDKAPDMNQPPLSVWIHMPVHIAPGPQSTTPVWFSPQDLNQPPLSGFICQSPFSAGRVEERPVGPVPPVHI